MKKIVILALLFLAILFVVRPTSAIQWCDGQPCPTDPPVVNPTSGTSGGGGTTTGTGGGGSTKCTCSGAYGSCTTAATPFGPAGVKYRTCTQSSTGTTTCKKIGGTFYDVVPCGATGVSGPSGATGATGPSGSSGGGGGGGGGGSPNPTPGGCSYCSTGACNQCSTYASGWKCKCDNFNGSVYSSCKGVLDPTCGVPQPTPTGVPAGLCNRCTTGVCGACSDYAPGWRCNCSQPVGQFFKNCIGEIDTTGKCGTPQATPTPPCGKKSSGDADCDGSVTLKDYFYYVAKKAGVTLPGSVNVDFNASGAVDDADRAIVVKTLKP